MTCLCPITDGDVMLLVLSVEITATLTGTLSLLYGNDLCFFFSLWPKLFSCCPQSIMTDTHSVGQSRSIFYPHSLWWKIQIGFFSVKALHTNVKTKESISTIDWGIFLRMCGFGDQFWWHKFFNQNQRTGQHRMWVLISAGC